MYKPGVCEHPGIVVNTIIVVVYRARCNVFWDIMITKLPVQKGSQLLGFDQWQPSSRQHYWCVVHMYAKPWLNYFRVLGYGSKTLSGFYRYTSTLVLSPSESRSSHFGMLWHWFQTIRKLYRYSFNLGSFSSKPRSSNLIVFGHGSETIEIFINMT